MIPVSLSISGFLSYKDPAEIDFTSFDLACISGQNRLGIVFARCKLTAVYRRFIGGGDIICT